VPEGADAYVLKWVIHGCNNKEAPLILRNCGRAIQPNGGLLLIEQVLKSRNEFDLLPMLNTGRAEPRKGRERTKRGYQQLLQGQVRAAQSNRNRRPIVYYRKNAGIDHQLRGENMN
jgi:hypothetical protein